MTRRFTVIAQRADAWWSIRVKELPGVFSQARRLDGIESMARDAIALFLDVDPNTFDITVARTLDLAIEQLVTEALQARATAAEGQRVASARSRQAARALAHLGLPQRDIGQLLELSHQRVAQLLVETNPEQADARQRRRARSHR
jgi:predicted RNase H-like HicB family nuclease